MSRVLRVIEYEAPDDAAGATWLERTLAGSIDGTYRLPNGCTITACVMQGPLDYIDYVALERACDIAWTPAASIEWRQWDRGNV